RPSIRYALRFWAFTVPSVRPPTAAQSPSAQLIPVPAAVYASAESAVVARSAVASNAEAPIRPAVMDAIIESPLDAPRMGGCESHARVSSPTCQQFDESHLKCP